MRVVCELVIGPQLELAGDGRNVIQACTRTVPNLRPTAPLLSLSAETDLHSLISVALFCLDLHDRARTGLDCRDGNRFSVLGKQLRHPDLFAY